MHTHVWICSSRQKFLQTVFVATQSGQMQRRPSVVVEEIVDARAVAAVQSRHETAKISPSGVL